MHCKSSSLAILQSNQGVFQVKPTQQVPPNIQDQVDINAYQNFPAPPLPPPMSQASLQQQQQHLLPQSQVNPLHQQHSYQFYENILPQQQQPPPPPPPPQQQPAFNRVRFKRLLRSRFWIEELDICFFKTNHPHPPHFLDLFINFKFYQYRCDKFRFFEYSIFTTRKFVHVPLLSRCQSMSLFSLSQMGTLS